MKSNRYAAVICWFISVAFTVVFFTTMGEIPLYIAIGLGAFVQGVLTIGERPLWRWAFKRANGRFALMGTALTLVDGMLNAAGMYKNIPKLAGTGVGVMLVDAFGFDASIGKKAAFGIALFIGTVVGGLPEYLWELD